MRSTRPKLARMEGKRTGFVGTVERLGVKSGWAGPEPTILLRNVKHNDSEVTDHLWFNRGKSWDGIKPGDIVSFDARVALYEGGYKGRQWEVQLERPLYHSHKLERPTKIKLVGQEEGATT